MSMVDQGFEYKAITLLKGIYDNVGGGLPYKIISGKMYFNEGLDTLTIDELVNQTEYYIDANAGIFSISLSLSSLTAPLADLNRCQLFLGPAQAINSGTDPAFFTINNNGEDGASWNIAGFVANAEDLSAFGSITRPVDFEIRMYI